MVRSISKLFQLPVDGLNHDNRELTYFSLPLPHEYSILPAGTIVHIDGVRCQCTVSHVEAVLDGTTHIIRMCLHPVGDYFVDPDLMEKRGWEC